MTADRTGAGAGRFSVVIPTHDRAAQVEALVIALRALDAPPDQIVVVADGCHDDTLERLAALDGPDLEVVATDGVGPASARNLGADRCGGEWLVFLDDDDEPDAAWLATFRHLAEAHPAARYVTVPHRSTHGDRTDVHPVRNLGPAFGSVVAGYMPGTFAVRRDAFVAAGGYLAGLRYLECTELGARLFNELAASPDAFAHGTEPTITRHVPDLADRASVVPASLVPSSRRAHESLDRYLVRDRPLYANSLATLGVAEARTGDLAAARSTLRRAAAADPWPPRHVARAVLAHVPVLAAKVWRQAGS